MMSTSFLGFFDRSGLVAGGPATIASGLSQLVITGLVPTLSFPGASVSAALGQLVLNGKVPTLYPDAFFLISGFVGYSGLSQATDYDRTNASGAWYANHQAIDVSLYHYHYSTTSESAPGWSTDWKYFPFDINGNYFMVATSNNNVDDTATFDVTFMAGATEIASIWYTTSGFNTRMSMSTVLYSESVGSSNTQSAGNLTFTSSSIVFTNAAGSSGTSDLSLGSLAMTTCDAIRVRATALACDPVGTTAWSGMQMQKLS